MLRRLCAHMPDHTTEIMRASPLEDPQFTRTLISRADNEPHSQSSAPRSHRSGALSSHTHTITCQCLLLGLTPHAHSLSTQVTMAVRNILVVRHNRIYFQNYSYNQRRIRPQAEPSFTAHCHHRTSCTHEICSGHLGSLVGSGNSALRSSHEL